MHATLSDYYFLKKKKYPYPSFHIYALPCIDFSQGVGIFLTPVDVKYELLQLFILQDCKKNNKKNQIKDLKSQLQLWDERLKIFSVSVLPEYRAAQHILHQPPQKLKNLQRDGRALWKWNIQVFLQDSMKIP